MKKAGLHFAYSKRRRHPSTTPFLAPAKSKTDIFDLEKTVTTLDAAKELMKTLASKGKVILFVGTKPEAKRATKNAAEAIDMPYATNRWIGGAITNFDEIKGRVRRLEELLEKKEKNELSGYTKKERLLIDREIEDLEGNFGGLVSMKKLPDVMFVVDAKKESIAVKEADMAGITVVSLSSSDCDISKVAYPIVGNDGSRASIEYVLGELVASFKEGRTVAA